MALSNNAVPVIANSTVPTTETPSTGHSSISTTNSSSLFSSPMPSSHYAHSQLNHTHGTSFGVISPIRPVESSLSPKDIVIQLRQLSQDPHQQIHLMNNTESLRILSDSLLLETTTRASTETCIISLQTLQLLASNPNHRDTLKAIPNLSKRIDALCLSSQQRLQIIAKCLKETLNSKISSNMYQQYQPRPLLKMEFTIINLKTEKDRDEIQTIGIKINGIISVTVNMSSRDCIFYATRKDVKSTLVQSLRSNGFQVQTEEEKDEIDDVASIHSGISNFTDVNQNKARLSSLLIHDTNVPYRPKPYSAHSIIQERYNDENTDPVDAAVSSGPTYFEPQSMPRKGITKYNPNHKVMSLNERLQYEQKMQEEEDKKQQQTQ
eukprot:371445_1